MCKKVFKGDLELGHKDTGAYLKGCPLAKDAVVYGLKKKNAGD